MASKNVNTFKRGFKSESEKTSEELRATLGLSVVDPLPARKLADHLGIEILSPSDVFSDDHATKQILLASSEWSALTIIGKSGNKLILHNSTNTAARQESDLMHEIAHVLCNHYVDTTQIADIGVPLRVYDEKKENEANWLGACLQIPRKALLYYLREKWAMEKIAIHFNASLEMVRFRTNTTGVLRQIKSNWRS